MRKLLFIIVLLFIVSATSAQTGRSVILANVGLDSLKKVVEHDSGYLLFYVENKEDEPLKISVSWSETNMIANLGDALNRAGYSLSQKDNMLFVLPGAGIMTQLPDHYFSTTEHQWQDSIAYATVLSSSESREAGSANRVYVIGDPNSAFWGNRAVLSGYVKSLESREPIVGASVVVVATGTTVSTDIHGFYRVPVPVGKVDLVLTESGFEDTPLILEVFTDGILDITMKEKVYSLRSVVVSAEANQHQRTTHLGVERISIGRIRHIPAVFGEADVMKAVLTLPGVKTVGESSGGFNVRGGAADQNLVLFNEGTMYNPTHLFGLFSSLNPDMVNDIELYKSSIPAKYGGRVSSVLEVNSRQGNSSKITGSVGLGLLTGKFHLEGPIIKGRTNFIAGARSTYSNRLLRLLPQNSGYRNGTADFHDITTGFSHKVNNSNTCHLYTYYSGDKFSFSPDNTYSYRNENIAFKWRTIFNAKHNMSLVAGYDRYRHNVQEKTNPVNACDMRFALKQLFVKTNFDRLINEKHALSYGVNSVFINISPGEVMPIDSSLVVPDRIERERGWESALFVSDTWSISHRLSVDFGLRYTLYASPENTKYYHGPEYRLSARYLFDNNLTLKAGFNTMRQNIHMLSHTAAASPIDIWKLSNANIAPQIGWQAAAGIYRNFSNSQWELSLEGYYKTLAHYLDYKSGAVINMNKQIEEDVFETEGKAYGLELMVKKTSGKLNGWLAYSYSRTMLREAGKKEVYEINNGNRYPAAYDKPHDVKVVMNYKFTQRYSFSANLDYASGRPVTIPISVYYYGGGYRFEYSQRNQYRIPDYLRLDLSFNIEPSHNLRLWTYSVITFGIYNVTGRKNAFSVFYTTTEERKVQGYKLSIFGAPIPYINYTIKF